MTSFYHHLPLLGRSIAIESYRFGRFVTLEFVIVTTPSATATETASVTSATWNEIHRETNVNFGSSSDRGNDEFTYLCRRHLVHGY